MIDFTSALYLGMRHDSRSLRPWKEFTTGRPAALSVPGRVQVIAERLAALIGCDQAILAPSTLHLFWDLFGMLGGEEVAIYMDAGLYPIGRGGVERAAGLGSPVKIFSHHDTAALIESLQTDEGDYRRPVIVADGFCPGCGKPAPIKSYLECAQALGGYLIIDDTQALGIWGKLPAPGSPYGKGGGGSLRWGNIKGDEVVIISSLAKAFGVPVAVLAGSDEIIRRFKARSETRMHCSPPSLAVIHAAEHALVVNEDKGDALRRHLAQLVRYFRNGITKAGLSAAGGLFPVQMVVSGLNTVRVYERLLKRGVRTVLHRGRNGHIPRLSFLLTVLHRSEELDYAVEMLEQITRKEKKRAMTVRHDTSRL